jgi:hypothetical protein
VKTGHQITDSGDGQVLYIWIRESGHILPHRRRTG